VSLGPQRSHRVHHAVGRNSPAPALYSLAVNDGTVPVFTVTPGPITVFADTTGTAQVSFDVQATDNSGATPTIECTPASPAVFSFGTTPVNCTATDGSGNVAATMFDVTVEDNTAPLVMIDGVPPLDVTIEAGSPFMSPSAIAIDNVDGPVAVSLTGAVDTDTPGLYVLTYSAMDSSGNIGSAILSVTVQDSEAPTLSDVPADFTVAAVNTSGATVTYSEPTATDNSDQPLSLTCTPASDTLFPLGATAVTCTATDSSGNSASASFTVTVADQGDPTVVIAEDPFFAEIQDANGTIVDFSSNVSAEDDIDPAPSLDPTTDCSPASGTLFPPNNTAVTCTATDGDGNTGTNNFTVHVGYAEGLGIFVNKRVVKAGSTNQISWVWQDEDKNNVDTSADGQILRLVECSTPQTILYEAVGTPGQSGFFFRNDFTWEYNWQSDDPDSAEPLPRGTYCINVESDLTGDMLFSPEVQVK